ACGGDCVSWDTSACHICSPGTFRSCLEIGATAYTGGLAECSPLGTEWLTEGCTYCGDGETNGIEACDGSAAELLPTTCGDLGYEGTPETVVDQCSALCAWDTRECSRCPGSACQQGGGCNGADCSGRECAESTTCAVNCGYGQTACDEFVCGSGAACNYDCKGGGCTNAACQPGSLCNLQCQNSGGSCLGTTCRAGATCNFQCSNGGQCLGILCEPGAACSV